MTRTAFAVVVLLSLLVTTGLTAQQQLSLERELTIGALDGEYALTRPGHVVIMPDGHILVSQPDEQIVRHFDSRGRIVRHIGGRGEGPGEFRAISGVGIGGDSIWIADGRLRRMTYFSLHGNLLATLSWPGMARAPANPVGTGYASLEYSVNGTMALDPNSPWPVIRYSSAGEVMDTVAIVHAYTRAITATDGTALRSPLQDGAMSRFSPSGSRLVIVDRRVAASEGRGRFTVTWVDAARGDTLRRAAYAYTPKTIPEAHLTQLTARAANGPMRQHATAIAAALREQRFLPPISRMQVTTDTTVWLAREAVGQQTVRWYRFSMAEGATGYMELPATSMVMASDRSRIWVLEYDQFDVPYLVRYRTR